MLGIFKKRKPEEKLLEEANTSCQRIETGCSMEDIGQLRTHIEAFVEQFC